ncbi:MAG: MerR family transcriptional regulator [Candidatus Eremiobacterota bacterium]
MARDYLTLSELYEQAQELGLELSERTLKYYMARGLLPKPEKAPFPDADGRVSYFHRDSLKRVRRIVQLKNQGLTLDQIRKVLERKETEPLKQLTSPEDDWRRQVAFRYLHQHGGEEARRARMEFLASVLGTDREDLLQRSARRYLARLLTPLVGEAEAARYVDEFFFGLTPRELSRRMELFRRWREEERERSRREGDSPFQLLRRMAGDFVLGLLPAEPYRAELERVRTALAERRRQMESVEALDWKDEVLLAQYRAAMDLADESLGHLVAGSFEKDSTDLALGLEQFQQASQRLTEIGELARRYEALLGPPEDTPAG